MAFQSGRSGDRPDAARRERQAVAHVRPRTGLEIIAAQLSRRQVCADPRHDVHDACERGERLAAARRRTCRVTAPAPGQARLARSSTRVERCSSRIGWRQASPSHRPPYSALSRERWLAPCRHHKSNVSGLSRPRNDLRHAGAQRQGSTPAAGERLDNRRHEANRARIRIRSSRNVQAKEQAMAKQGNPTSSSSGATTSASRT